MENKGYHTFKASLEREIRKVYRCNELSEGIERVWRKSPQAVREFYLGVSRWSEVDAETPRGDAPECYIIGEIEPCDEWRKCVWWNKCVRFFVEEVARWWPWVSRDLT